MPQPLDDLRAEFGEIDIYLFDQLLRGRVTEGMRVLDAGCGAGRNLHFLMRRGFEVWGVDTSAAAVDAARRLASLLAPRLDAERFQVQAVECLSHGTATMDVVISSAVLHFARDDAHWTAMVNEMWRVLAPGGLFFARLATTVGQEDKLTPLGGRRFIMPDGDARYLVDHQMLLDTTARLGGTLVDPLKTSVVHGRRSMATWVVRK